MAIIILVILRLCYGSNLDDDNAEIHTTNPVHGFINFALGTLIKPIQEYTQ